MLAQQSQFNPLRGGASGAPRPAMPPPKPAGGSADADLCKNAIKALAQAVESGQTQGISQKIDDMLTGAPSAGAGTAEPSDAGGTDDGGY